jgi:U3 small nucleolar RNA-associated protein 13
VPIKLWTIRTNECEATLDGHTNKVWALDMSPDGQTVVSGGADSKLAVWQDNTQQVEDEERAVEAETVLLDQKLANHLRHKEYGKALEIALQVDKPSQVLKVITSIIENEIQQGKGNGMTSLRSHAKRWDMERVAQVLKYCRNWNTRARNASIAMMMVKAIVTSIPVDQLASAQGIPEILAGITPYAERHFDRLDRLHTSSYLLDFTLTSLGNLDPALDDASSEQDFAKWEASSKLVLPPKFVDGRIQVGGQAVIGKAKVSDDSSASGDDENDEVVSIGDSSTSDSSVNQEDEEDSDEEMQDADNQDAKDNGASSSRSRGDDSNL